MCVGYDAPIDFKPGALSHLLATSQLILKRVLGIFSRQYTLPTHVDSSSTEERQKTDLLLMTEVLPQMDIRLMALTPMERFYGDFCYINHSEALIPQSTGSLSPSTPLVHSVTQGFT